MFYDPQIFTLFESLEPDQFILAFYYAEQESGDLLARAHALAEEQSTGTWTEVIGETNDVKERCAARVIGVWELPEVTTIAEAPAHVERRFMVALAYPVGNVNGQIPELLTTLYGNISMLSKLKLVDVFFPKSFTKRFKGPKFGIEGLRKLCGVYDRPILLGMFKPCIGPSAQTFGEMFYEMGMGGLDIIKDDEKIADPDFCSVEARVEACLKANERIQKETGRRVLYAVNVTDRADRMMKKAERVLKMGNNMLMVNVFTTGYSDVQMLAEEDAFNVPLLGHPNMAGAYYCSPHWGFSASLTLAKFPRLAGVDIMNYPSQYGKIPLIKERAIRVAQEMKAPFHHIKPMWGTPSAGNHPGMVAEMVKDYGMDIVIGAGGAIHGHPGGRTAGVKAFLQAMKASVARFPLREAAKEHPELQAALEKWGVIGEQNIYDLTR